MSSATSPLAARKLGALIAQFVTPYIPELITILTVLAGLWVIR
jgi:hypothetical protein